MKPFLPAIVWAIAILGLSISPSIQLPETIVSPDKLGHLFAYGTLAWLVFRALSKKGSYSAKTAILAVTVVTSYGIALEFVQGTFFPNRYFEVWDMVANFAGAILSYFAFTFYFTKT